MIDKILKNAVRMNLLLWAAAILLPFLLQFIPASKEPKIYQVLIPILQFILAGAATKIVADSINAAGSAGTANSLEDQQ